MKNRRLKVILIICFILIVVSGGGYVNDYYPADMNKMPPLTDEIKEITCESYSDMIVFIPETVEAGLIFYPGGKVEAEAYIPIVSALAEEGIMGVIVKMPGKLAFLDINAADDVLDKWPEVDEWYMAGHSLGGVAGSRYVAENSDKFDGIVFLASYPTDDLTEADVKALSIYGSNDGVLNMKRYEKSRSLMPEDSTYVVIEGGNHAQFGIYGEQKGDGIASISGEEQIDRTVEEILDFIFKE